MDALLLLLLRCGAASAVGICEKTLLGKPCDAWGENEVSPEACTSLHGSQTERSRSE